MADRTSNVDRALKMQEGSVLAREVLQLRAREQAARPVLDAAEAYVRTGVEKFGADSAGPRASALIAAVTAYRAALGSSEAGAPAAEPAPDAAEWARGIAGEMAAPGLVICPAREHPSFLVDAAEAVGCPWCALAGAGAPEPAQDDEPQPRHGDLVDRWLSDYRDHRTRDDAEWWVVENLRDEWIAAAAIGGALAAGAPQPPEADRG
ncbi:MAG: hypothetical protein AB7I24_05520 [Candidatus Nanopelagicales bacterium]